MRADLTSRDELTAETTACRVLAWAARTSAQPGTVPSAALSAPAASAAATPENQRTEVIEAPPSGPLREPRLLADPAPGTVTLLRTLIQTGAARLGAGDPPFGDPGPAGLGAMFLAGAIGGRQHSDAALLVAEAIPPPRLTESAVPAGCWTDALARHCVVMPFLHVIEAQRIQQGPELSETMLRLSPLSVVLHRPAAGPDADAAVPVAAAAALAFRPRGADVLRTALARWSADPAVLAWRAELLARFAMSDRPVLRNLAIDTYVTARVGNGADWDTRLRRAQRVLSGRGLPDAMSMATVRYWAPLEALSRRDRDAVPSRPYLTGHETALALVRRYRLGVVGAA